MDHTDFLDVIDCLDKIVDPQVNQFLRETTDEDLNENDIYRIVLDEIFMDDIDDISKTYARLFDLGVRWIYKGVVKCKISDEDVYVKISPDSLTEPYRNKVKVAVLSELFDRVFLKDQHPSRFLFIGSKPNSAMFEYKGQRLYKFATRQEIDSALVFLKLGLYQKFAYTFEHGGYIEFEPPLQFQEFSWDMLKECIKILEFVCKQYKIQDISIESFVKFNYKETWHPAIIGCHIEEVEKQEPHNPILVQRIAAHVERLLYSIDYENLTPDIKRGLIDTYSMYLTEDCIDYLETGPCLLPNLKELANNVYQRGDFIYKVYEENDNELYFINLLKSTELIPEVFSSRPCFRDGETLVLVKEAKYEGTLRDFVEKNKDNPKLVMEAFTEIVRKNLILNRDFRIRQVDFGLLNTVYKTNKDGTFDWRFIDFEDAIHFDENGNVIRGTHQEWNPYADLLSFQHAVYPPVFPAFKLVGQDVAKWDKKFLESVGEADLEMFAEADEIKKSYQPIGVYV